MRRRCIIISVGVTKAAVRLGTARWYGSGHDASMDREDEKERNHETPARKSLASTTIEEWGRVVEEPLSDRRVAMNRASHPTPVRDQLEVR